MSRNNFAVKSRNFLLFSNMATLHNLKSIVLRVYIVNVFKIGNTQQYKISTLLTTKDTTFVFILTVLTTFKDNILLFCNSKALLGNLVK